MSCTLHVLTDHLCIFFGKMVVLQFFRFPLLSWDVSVEWVLAYIIPPVRYVLWKYFLPFVPYISLLQWNHLKHGDLSFAHSPVYQVLNQVCFPILYLCLKWGHKEFLFRGLYFSSYIHRHCELLVSMGEMNLSSCMWPCDCGGILWHCCVGACA